MVAVYLIENDLLIIDVYRCDYLNCSVVLEIKIRRLTKTKLLDINRYRGGGRTPNILFNVQIESVYDRNNILDI